MNKQVKTILYSKVWKDKDSFKLFWDGLSTELNNPEFMDEKKMFYSVDSIYFSLGERYDFRLLRYSRPEFINYFRGLLRSHLPALYLKQQVFVESTLDTIKDFKLRGAIQESIANGISTTDSNSKGSSTSQGDNNSFNTPETFAGKATDLTDKDSVAFKSKDKSSATNQTDNSNDTKTDTKNSSTGKVINFINDLKAVINIAMKQPISDFLDKFNDLFVRYITENTSIDDSDRHIYDELKGVILTGSAMIIDWDDANATITFSVDETKIPTKQEFDEFKKEVNATLRDKADIRLSNLSDDSLQVFYKYMSQILKNGIGIQIDVNATNHSITFLAPDIPSMKDGIKANVDTITKLDNDTQKAFDGVNLEFDEVKKDIKTNNDFIKQVELEQTGLEKEVETNKTNIKTNTESIVKTDEQVKKNTDEIVKLGGGKWVELTEQEFKDLDIAKYSDSRFRITNENDDIYIVNNIFNNSRIVLSYIYSTDSTKTFFDFMSSSGFTSLKPIIINADDNSIKKGVSTKLKKLEIYK